MALADCVYVALVMILLQGLAIKKLRIKRQENQTDTGFTDNLGLHGAGS